MLRGATAPGHRKFLARNFRVPANFVFAKHLANDVGQKRHEAGALDGLRERALTCG
jgi:hypothetical protein